jgi:RecG-like helicase
MKKILTLLLAMVVMMACTSENENTMFVKGTVKGLKKGTLYLHKQIDSLVVAVDSVFVDGTDEFLLSDVIESPEMYYVSLGEGDKRIAFFGEKDTVQINTVLDKFDLRAEISGSANHDLLEKFYDMKTKFNDQNLDLIKEEFEARKAQSQDSLDAVSKKMKSLERRRYLYTTNFAVTNNDYEVSPYIALTELNYANVKLLDTINASLTDKVKQSKYGKEFDSYVKRIKESEQN